MADVAGRPTREIEVASRRRGPVTLRLWLDRETGFALNRERYNVEGRLISGTEYLQVTYRVPVSPDTFSIPADWQVEDLDGGGTPLGLSELGRRLGFPVIQPRYLPPGYVLQGAYSSLRGRHRRPTAELRYTDGLRVLSVAQRLRGEEEGRKGEEDDRHRGRGREGEGEGSRQRGEGRGRGSGPHGGDEASPVDRDGEKAVRYRGKQRVVVVVGDLTPEELTAWPAASTTDVRAMK